MDELVKEYLLYRGFNGAVRALDVDLKSDKDKAFRVHFKNKFKISLVIDIDFLNPLQPDKIVEQFISYITIYDLNGLRDYWNHFDQLVFERLDHNFIPGLSSLHFTIINAVFDNLPFFSYKKNGKFPSSYVPSQCLFKWKARKGPRVL